MKSSTKIVSILAEQFVKEAGLIKVPTKLLNEAYQYILAAYSTDMIEELDPIIKASKERTKIVNMVSDRYDAWGGVVDLLTITAENRSVEHLRSFETFFLKRRLKPIPFIDSAENDPTTGIPGIIDLRKQSFYLFIFDNEDGEGNKDNTYQASIDIKMQESSERIKDSKMKMSLDETFDWISEKLPLITKAMEEIGLALRELRTHPTEKYMIASRAILASHARNLDTTSSSNFMGQQFFVKKDDLPYNKTIPNGMQEIFLSVQFIDSKERARSYNRSEDWSGLWQRANLIKSRGYIGTVYVMSEVKKDVLKISNDYSKSQSTLDAKFADLHETLRHELQHLMQTFIQFTSHSSEEIEKDKRFDYGVSLKMTTEGKIRAGKWKLKQLRNELFALKNGKPTMQGETEQSLLQKIRELMAFVEDLEINGYDPTGSPRHGLGERTQGHELRDVEFQTDLSDQVNKFLLCKTNFPTPLHRPLALLWIGHISEASFSNLAQDYFKKQDDGRVLFNDNYKNQLRLIAKGIDYLKHYNHFFDSLKSGNILKYQKASKEFMKAVGL
jgi:hypothetical protein